MYTRNCPECHRKQIYADRSGFNLAKRRNSLCRFCAQTKSRNRLKFRLAQSKRMIGDKNPNKRLDIRAKSSQRMTGNKNPMFGRCGNENPNYGKHHETYYKLDKWKRYKLDVRRITEQQPLHILNDFDKRGRNGVPGAYQVDHKISICEGFRQNLPVEVIGNITNLQMLRWEVNAQKQTKCI